MEAGQGWRPRACLASRPPGGSGSPSAGTNETGRPSVGWTRQGEREETPALGALEKSARAAEATVLEPKVATMERREARRASRTFAQTAQACLRRKARRRRKAEFHAPFGAPSPRVGAGDSMRTMP